MTALVIWYIGFAFTYGFIVPGEDDDKSATWVYLKIGAILFLAWPLLLGFWLREGKYLEKDEEEDK